MKSLSKLAVKIIAIVLMTKAAINLMGNVAYLLTTEGRTTASMAGNALYITYIPLIMTIVIAIILWVLSDKISHWMSHENDAESLSLQVNYEQLFNLVLKVVGIILFIIGLGQLISNGLMVHSIRNYFNFREFYLRCIQGFTIPCIQIIAGVFLFFKSHLLVRNHA